MLKKIYLSPIGYLVSFIMSMAFVARRPFMIYGYYNKVQKKFCKLTRISSSAVLIEKINLDIDDNAWVWHYTILDASNGIKIGRGCQIGAWVGIFSHSSHIAIRLLGEKYIEIDKTQRTGYQRGPVEIGEYTFIGAHSIILPDVKIGKGCIVGAKSMVTKSFPDYSIVSGNPAEVIGDTRTLDRKFLKNAEVQKTYYDSTVVENYLIEKNVKKKERSEDI